MYGLKRLLEIEEERKRKKLEKERLKKEKEKEKKRLKSCRKGVQVSGRTGDFLVVHI